MGTQESKVVDITSVWDHSAHEQETAPGRKDSECSGTFQNDVVEFARKYAQLQDMTGASLSRVLVIYSGGTIGMKKDPISGYVPAQGFLTEFLATDRRFHDEVYLESLRSHSDTMFGINTMHPELGEILTMPMSMYGKRVAYQVYEFEPLKDSCNMTSEDWIQIASCIEDHYHNYDAFIVLHGTDTMAYSASALSFLLENLGKTVIFTGSQVPFSELRNDAYENLLGALTLAGHYVIPEVSLFFDNNLLRGNRTTKVNAVDFHAFDSPNLKPLAHLGVNINIEWTEVLRPNTIAPFRACKNLTACVGCMRLFPGMPASSIRAFTAPPMQGVVLETFGTGNAPDDRPDLLDALADAVKRGVVIVNVTQCAKGAAAQLYSTGHAITSIGVVAGRDMTTECALTKLNYLLSNKNYTIEKVKRLIVEPLRGELTVPAVHTTGVERKYDSLLASILSTTIRSCQDAVRDMVARMLRPLLLHEAAAQGDVQALQELICPELHVDAVDYEDKTCLFAAVARNNMQAVRWLIEQGANVHTRDKYGNSAMVYAVRSVLSIPAEEVADKIQIIRLMGAAGAHLKGAVLSNEIMTFVEHGNMEMLSMIYEFGGSILSTDRSGRNITHIAVAHDRIEVLKWVMSKSDLGVLVDMKDLFGRTALDEARGMGCRKIAVEILEAGAMCNHDTELDTQRSECDI